jgi:hypothetical protein
MLHAPETDCSTFWEVVQFMGLGIKNHIVIAGTEIMGHDVALGGASYPSKQ